MKQRMIEDDEEDIAVITEDDNEEEDDGEFIGDPEDMLDDCDEEPRSCWQQRHRRQPQL
jgi:hypothetical protein